MNDFKFTLECLKWKAKNSLWKLVLCFDGLKFVWNVTWESFIVSQVQQALLLSQSNNHTYVVENYLSDVDVDKFIRNL